ncbi:MAG: DUF4838 domain-containing protein [Kiritimatiellae bacterium]|nr:DUF4838 domain-containing protein [Kiritimatiellia bacterium]
MGNFTGVALGLALATTLSGGGIAAGGQHLAAALTLARDGQPAALIVLAAQPTRAAQFAAFELQYHVQKITGATLPIARTNVPPEGTRIFVGESGATRAMGLCSTNFAHQEYLIRVVGPATIILMGRDADDRGAVDYANAATWPGWYDDRATCFAVHDFLERFCGVRWLNPTESGTALPITSTLTVAVTDVQRAPFFKMRTGTVVDWLYPAWDAYDAGTGTLWAHDSPGYSNYVAVAYPSAFAQAANDAAFRTARARAAKLFMHRQRLGGQRFLCNHSMNGYYGRFRDTHPEWFAQGHPITANSQFCYANTGFVGQVAADAAAYYDGQPAPGQWWKSPNTFPVAPQDTGGYCTCADCEQWKNADASVYFSVGRVSDLVFNFINAVATRLQVTHPGKRLIALAYDGYAAPPTRVSLNTNVDVQFCFSANQTPYKVAEYNHELDHLKAWGEEARRSGRNLSLWMYGWGGIWWGQAGRGSTFNPLPSYFAHKADEQFKLYRDYNYQQGMFYDGWLQEVDAYISLKLMDDPSRNVETLLTDYFVGLYGPRAGAPMRQMYAVLEDTYCNPTNYPWFYAKVSPETLCWGWLGTAARMATMSNLMAQAKAAATDEPWMTNVKLFETGTWDCMVAGRRHFEETHPAPTIGLTSPTVTVFTVSTPISLGVKARAHGSAIFGLASKNLWSSNSVLAQGWHHVLATHDQDKMELFVDGLSQESCPYIPVGLSQGRPYLGNAAGGKGLIGTLDEVRFSSCVRHGAETYSNQLVRPPDADTNSTLLLRFESSLPEGSVTSGCPVWASGKHGTAMEFHGADGVSFPTVALPVLPSNVGSLELWLQLKSNGTNDHGRIFTIWDDAGGWQMLTTFGFGVGYTTESHAVKVDYFDGDTLIGTTTTYPYDLTWTNVAAGTHIIKARATDFANLSTVSTSVTITVVGNP